jgi:hypothetical protein
VIARVKSVLMDRPVQTPMRLTPRRLGGGLEYQPAVEDRSRLWLARVDGFVQDRA